MVKTISTVTKRVAMADGEQVITVQIKGANNKMLGLNDIQQLYAGMQKQYKKDGKEIKTVIRGVNCVEPLTLKGMNTNLWMDVDGYYSGRVKDTQKFDEFSQIQFTIHVT